MVTIQPDQGMAALFPRRDAVPYTGPVGPAAPAATADLDIMARLSVTLDGVSDAVRRLAAARERARLSWEECHIVDIPPGQSEAAGEIDQPDQWGPRAGWAWQVLWVAAVLGPAGTSMSLYRDAVSPTNVVIGPVGSGLYEPKGLILLPGRRMIWTSAGDMLTVSSSQAVEIALDRLPDYLM